jgi:hypothetical protein
MPQLDDIVAMMPPTIAPAIPTAAAVKLPPSFGTGMAILDNKPESAPTIIQIGTVTYSSALLDLESRARSSLGPRTD